MAYGGGLTDVWVYVDLFVALVGLACLHGAIVQVSADPYGVHSRTLLRRRSVPWRDIADLRVYVRGGRTRRLPLSASVPFDDRPDVDAKLDALRALHRCHGTPESSHVPVRPLVRHRRTRLGPCR